MDLSKALSALGFKVRISPTLLSYVERSKPANPSSPFLESVKSRLSNKDLQLYPHQEAGIGFLSGRTNAALFDSMGVGKTCQSICSIPEGSPVVVICPAVVKQTWVNEFAIWADSFRCEIISGRGNFRWPQPGEVVICNYEILPSARSRGKLGYCIDEEFGNPHTGTVVICDEVHKAKNPNAKRSKSTKAIARAATNRKGKIWLLTGTPLMNRPPELWNILGIADLQRKSFGTWKNFVFKFNGRPTGYNRTLEWGDPRPEVPSIIRKVSLRRTLTAVVKNMPPKTRQDIVVDIDKQTQAQCEKAMLELDKLGIRLEDALNSSIRSRKEAPAFQELSRARSMLAISKVPAALSIIEEYEEAEEPLIVFSSMRGPIDSLIERDGWEVITGGIASSARGPIVDKFQKGGLKGLGLTIGAGGVGITLTTGAYALFVDLDWNPANNSQAEDRIHRIGQSRPQLIKRIIANHALDQKICSILTKKQRIIEASVGASAIGKGE
tara:strand:- start:919 stop:2406 length:1488 start_codon:yes stop_codon:yes gene_type:complete